MEAVQQTESTPKETAAQAAAVPRGAITLEDVDGGNGTPVGYAGQRISKPKEAKEAKEEVTKDEAGDEEESVSSESKVEEVAKKLSKESEENTSKEKTEVKTDETKKETKFHTVKFGDQKVKIPVDATFKHTVNGESVIVQLSDLLNNYSGKTDYSKKYSELNKERQEYNTQVKTLNDQLNGLHKMLTEKGDARTVLMTLAEAFGADPKAVWKNFSEKAKEQIQQFSQLTEEQWKLKELEEELQWRNHKEETERQKTQAAEVQSKITARVQAVLDNTKMDEQTFRQIYEDLVKKGVSVSELTPEHIEGEYVEREASKNATSLIESVNPDMPAERKAQAIAELKKHWKDNPKFTLEDWREIAVEAYGNTAAKNLSKKLKKSGNKNSPKTDKVISAKHAPLSFDELE